MLLPDVNVLIYAHVEDSIPDHDAYAAWVTRLATGPEPFALSVLVLSGFICIVTNPRAFNPPSTLDQSFAFVTLRSGAGQRFRSSTDTDLHSAEEPPEEG